MKDEHDASQPGRVLAARWIIPVSRDPINGGWVRVKAGRIVEVEAGRPPAGAEDLGDVALLPGLVNAHTHLEFSDLDRPIGDRGIPLTDWIGEVVTARERIDQQDKRAAVEAGIGELCESGTRLVGEIATPPCHYWEHQGELELITFAEVLGLSSQRADERLAAARRHCTLHPSGAVSPHAPYSTLPDTIRSCVGLAREFRRPLAMHVAESPAERELLCNGTGPFRDALRTLGVWRQELFPWCEQPLSALIDWLAPAPRVLLIHGNDLGDDELHRICPHDHFTIVFCPRTHHFFAYDKHPVDRMLAAGVRVALGTDSRASNPDLNVWREVQFLLRHRTDLPPSQVLRMATINGADAFGRSDMGRIEVSCRSQLGCVSTSAASVDQLFADFSCHEYERISRC